MEEEEDPSYSESWDSESSDSDEEDVPVKKPTRRSGRQQQQGTAKKAGNSGKELARTTNDKDHVSTKPTRQVDRRIGPPCKCGCLEGIGEETVKKIFEEFWAIGDYSKQNAHLGTRLILVDDPPPDSQQGGAKEPNAIPLIRAVIYTVFYNNIVYKVCRRAFYSIHSIGEKRVRNIINKLKKRGVESDLRKRPNNIIQNIQMRRRIVQHILKATNGELPSVKEAGSSKFSVRPIYDSYLESVDGLSPKYQVSYAYYCEVFYDLLKKRQTEDESNTANAVPSQHHYEDGESSKDSTSSSDPPASNVPAPKTLGKETVSTPVSNQDKTKDYINKGNSSSIANPRLILPKLSLILVPCAPEVPKETQSKSEEPPKAAGSEEPPKASENQEPPDISDSQGPPNVSESQGSPGVSESQPVVQNAAKQQNAADNLTDVLPVITSTPPHHSASMKLKEIKEELLDISEVYTDQDIPTEYGNLSPVHHRSQITKEKLETTGNDPLQLDCFDSDDVTELVTDNSQPCRTDTIEKKKVIDTRNKRKGTETPNKRRGTDISNKRKRKRKTSDESEELTGSNEMGEENRMEESGCDTFGKFIALQLRQLPIKNALNLQMDIHNLIAKERLKVLQEEMGKPVKVANKRPRNDSSRHKSSTKKAAKDKITYREKTTVNEEPNTKSRSVKKTASVTKQSKDSIQQEVPHKRSRYSGSPEKQSPVTTCLVLDKGSPYQGIPLTKPIVNPEFRVQGSLGESSPVITAAIVPQPNELYTFGKPFGNESLLNIPLTKSEAYHDDISPWDAPSPISVKSEAESISSL